MKFDTTKNKGRSGKACNKWIMKITPRQILDNDLVIIQSKPVQCHSVSKTVFSQGGSSYKNSKILIIKLVHFLNNLC